MNGVFQAFAAYVRSIGVLSKYRLWSYAVIPGLVSIAIGIVIFILLGSLGGMAVDGFFSWLCNIYPESWPVHDGICNFTEWLSGSWFGEILSWLLSLMLNLLLFRYIVLVVIGPFMGTLSEKVEHHLTGKPADAMTTTETINSILRGLRIMFRNIFREIFWVLALTLLGLLIPGVGTIISAGLIFIIQSFYAGFGNVDPVLDRKKINLKSSVSYARQNRGWLTANGIPFLLILFIPFLGWFLGPVLATVASTLTYLKTQPS